MTIPKKTKLVRSFHSLLIGAVENDQLFYEGYEMLQAKFKTMLTKEIFMKNYNWLVLLRALPHNEIKKSTK